ncbi:MAG: endonuclease/exonuclease/phosphatase family protein [Deltaproteobacteria bacterium]|nr:endonuclease/exonuclease/phosphatase family protein [Deltaproteobacteria bacterium]
MRVMTFNLRFENNADGKNSWQYRKTLVTDLILTHRPDVLGTQEGKWGQLMYLKAELSDYHAHLPNRKPHEYAQCPTLFIRKSAFSITGGNDFWLSKTPDVFLSKDWDSAYPRMISFADIVCKKTGKKLCVAVTHLDNIGKIARIRQAELIAGWMTSLHAPVVLTGDFNDAPDSEVHDILAGPGACLKDSWQAAKKGEGPDAFTHHGFTGQPNNTRMDWIFSGNGLEVADVRIIRDHDEGRYPSDHYPYMADLKWTDG